MLFKLTWIIDSGGRMRRTTSRELKRKIGQLLLLEDREAAILQLGTLPEDRLVGPLISHFYSLEDIIRFRSVSLMGVHVDDLGNKNMEKARIIVRRLMWSLNDESGGIGWGACEAMGEILRHSRNLAMEYGTILFSYLDPKGNHLEHEDLQRGLLWGVGTYMASVESIDVDTVENIRLFLDSPDIIKRGYAVRALMNSDIGSKYIPDDVFNDHRRIPVFDGWHMTKIAIADLVHTKRGQ